MTCPNETTQSCDVSGCSQLSEVVMAPKKTSTKTAAKKSATASSSVAKVSTVGGAGGVLTIEHCKS